MPNYRVTVTRVKGYPGQEIDLGIIEALDRGHAIGKAKAIHHEKLGLYLTESGWRPCNQRYKATLV